MLALLAQLAPSYNATARLDGDTLYLSRGRGVVAVREVGGRVLRTYRGRTVAYPASVAVAAVLTLVLGV